MRSPALLYSSFAAAVLIATLSPAHAQTSPDAGQIAYNNACRTCHSIKEAIIGSALASMALSAGKPAQ